MPEPAPNLSEFKSIILKLYDLGILSTLKENADKLFTGKVILELDYNTGGIGSAYNERIREKIKKK